MSQNSSLITGVKEFNITVGCHLDFTSFYISCFKGYISIAVLGQSPSLVLDV